MRELRVASLPVFASASAARSKWTEESARAEANCYSLGELIHNDDVVQHLRSEGLTGRGRTGADPAGRVGHHPFPRRQPCRV